MPVNIFTNLNFFFKVKVDFKIIHTIKKILRGADFHHVDLNGQPSLNSDDEIITVNVSGMQYQTMDSTLRRFPSSILGNPNKRKRYWNAKTNEYFFDRHRPRFFNFKMFK